MRPYRGVFLLSRRDYVLVYHIVEQDDIINDDYYVPSSYVDDGFIHLSFKDQYKKVAESLYLDYDTLHLLEIDTELLEDKDKLIVEDLYNLNEKYPHLYAPLNTSSIVSVSRLRNVNQEFIKENNNE